MPTLDLIWYYSLLFLLSLGRAVLPKPPFAMRCRADITFNAVCFNACRTARSASRALPLTISSMRIIPASRGTSACGQEESLLFANLRNKFSRNALMCDTAYITLGIRDLSASHRNAFSGGILKFGGDASASPPVGARVFRRTPKPAPRR